MPRYVRDFTRRHPAAFVRVTTLLTVRSKTSLAHLGHIHEMGGKAQDEADSSDRYKSQSH